MHELYYIKTKNHVPQFTPKNKNFFFLLTQTFTYIHLSSFMSVMCVHAFFFENIDYTYREGENFIKYHRITSH